MASVSPDQAASDGLGISQNTLRQRKGQTTGAISGSLPEPSPKEDNTQDVEDMQKEEVTWGKTPSGVGQSRHECW